MFVAEGAGLNKRHEYIYRRAGELAASGYHINPITVVTALIQEGYAEAAELLNSEVIRADLRRLCAENWRGVRPAELVASVVASHAKPVNGARDHQDDPEP